MEQVKSKILSHLAEWLARCNLSGGEPEKFLAGNAATVDKFVADPAEPVLLVCVDSSLTRTFFSLDFGRLYNDSADGPVFCLVLVKRQENFIAAAVENSSSFNSLFLQFSWNSSLSDIQKFLKTFVDPFFKQLNEENSQFKVVNPRRFRILPNIRKKLSEIDHFIVNLQQDFDIPDIRLALDPVFTAISSEHISSNTTTNTTNNSFSPQFLANICKNAHLINSALECAQQWYTELNLLTQYSAFSTISSSLHQLSSAPPDQFAKSERTITGITNNNLDDVSVDREINFWSTYQYAVEQSITILKGVPFILVIEILKQIKKDNITTLIDQLYKCRINIENVLKFLGSLSLYNFSGNVGFLPFNQFDTEFVNINQFILDFFTKLINLIGEKSFQTENYYSVSNIIYLVHAVNKDFTKSIIRCIKNFATFNELPIKNFFMTQVNSIPASKKNELDLLRNVKLVIHAWEDEFDKFHKTIRELAKARLDDSMKILWKISFAHRSLHERLESIKSIRQNHASLTRILLNVDPQKKMNLDAIYEQMFISGGIDNLDISTSGNAQWTVNVNKYKQESDSCETFIANYLKMLLEKEKNLKNNSSMLLLCAKFNSLFNRPLIRNVVVEYQAVLLNHIYQRLDNISVVINRGYLVNKNGDCYLHSLYNVPGNIGLILFYQQLNNQLDKLHQHLVYVLGTDYELHIDGQRLKSSILQLKENVNCNKLFDKWVENFGGCNTFESLINSHCLGITVDPNNNLKKLTVNFDVNLLRLIKEARYLRALNFRLPLTILNATHQVSSIAHLVTRLVESVDVFNSCDSSYYTTHYRAAQDFVLNHFCRQGTTWDSYKVESFVFQFSDLMNKVNLLQQTVMMIENDILLLTEKLKVCPFNSVGEVLKNISLSVDSFLDADVCLQAKQDFVDSCMKKVVDVVFERNKKLCLVLLGLFGVNVEGGGGKKITEYEKKNNLLYIQQFVKNNRIKCRVMIGGKHTILLQPSKNSILHQINNFINDLFEVMNSGFVENFNSLRYAKPVSFDKLISFEVLNKVFKVFFSGYHDLMQIMGNLQVLVRFVVQLSNEEFYLKLNKDDNVIELIENLNAVRKNFKYYQGEFVVNVVFFIDMVDFSTVVLNKTDEKIEFLKEKLKVIIHEKINYLNVLFEELNLFVSEHQQKSTVECCIKTMDSQKAYNSVVVPLIKLVNNSGKYIEVGDVDKIVAMQKSFEESVSELSVKYVNDESKQQASNQIMKILQEVDEKITEIKNDYEENFKRKLIDFVECYNSVDDKSSQNNCILDEKLTLVLDKILQDLSEINETINKAHADSTILNIQNVNSNMDKFNQLKNEITTNKSVFDTTVLFEKKLNTFSQLPFQTANIDQLEVKLQKLFTNTNTNMTPSEYTAPLKNYMKKKYDRFNSTLLHVKSLNAACLMGKHFDLLQEQIKINQLKYSLKSNTCPIEAFLSVEIVLTAHHIQKIIQMAQGERSVHELINSIVESYRAKQIVVIVQNQTQVIKNFDEILVKIADHLSGLDSIRQSPYIGEFEQQIGELENKLNELHLFFVGLMDLQRVWLYLDGLISNSDIQKLMPSLSADFIESSSGVVSVIKKTANCEKFFDILKLFDGETVIESLSVALSKIQNSLIDYLQQQRMACPRLYFMGDDDVLSLLGSCTDCSLFSVCVDKFLCKMFPAIHKIVCDVDSKKMAVTGIESKSGEKIMFSLCCEGDGDGSFNYDKQSIQHFIINLDEFVKKFLMKLTVVMKRAFEEVIESADSNSAVEFVKTFPEQFICLVINIYFSEKLTDNKLSLESIKKVYTNLSNFLKVISSHFFGVTENNSIDSHKVNQICNVIIYNLDKLTLFEKSKNKSLQFEKILRFYLIKDQVVIKINDCSFNYSYEYLGQYDRLVRTNLTDQCYDTLTQSLKCGMGGSPFGPAGTGKTESVKALGAELGRYVLVFNCDKNFDFYSIVRIITGLSSIGAWGCFDEFNRLETRMLSAVSQKLQSVQTALRESKLKSSSMTTTTNKNKLNTNMAIFITMNPNYKGRSTLPQNLKKLFLSIAMSKPDRARIAHVILAGKTFFMEGVDLPHVSKNLVSFFMLCMDMLSKQVHYDWGLRALKAVLNSCLSQLDKLTSLSSDDFMGVLLNSLQWACVPKLNESDLSKFKYIFGLMFDKYTVYRQLTFVDDRLDMLAHLWSIHHGIIISGPCYSGKSFILDQYIDRAFENKKSVRLHRIDPKSSSVTELYGWMNVNTREWTDGIFTSILRNIDESMFHVIVFDGDVDPDWIENLNSVLDDNKLFTLVTGERLVIPENVKIIFETCNLENATLATISRCGLLNCDKKQAATDMAEVMKSNNLNKVRSENLSFEGVDMKVVEAIATAPYDKVGGGSTIDRTIFTKVIKELLNNNIDVLVYSDRATGKSKLLKNIIKQPQTKHIVLYVGVSTTPNQLINQLLTYTSYKKIATGTTLNCGGYKKCAIHIKFCNTPEYDDYNSQIILAFIRQMVAYRGFYRFSDGSWIDLSKFLCVFIVEISHEKMLIRDIFIDRFIRHFFVIKHVCDKAVQNDIYKVDECKLNLRRFSYEVEKFKQSNCSSINEFLKMRNVPYVDQFEVNRKLTKRMHFLVRNSRSNVEEDILSKFCDNIFVVNVHANYKMNALKADLVNVLNNLINLEREKDFFVIIKQYEHLNSNQFDMIYNFMKGRVDSEYFANTNSLKNFIKEVNFLMESDEADELPPMKYVKREIKTRVSLIFLNEQQAFDEVEKTTNLPSHIFAELFSVTIPNLTNVEQISLIQKNLPEIFLSKNKNLPYIIHDLDKNTSTNITNFTNVVSKIFTDKKNNYDNSYNHLKKGINQIETSSFVVNQLKTELQEKQITLNQANKLANEKLTQMLIDQQKAEKQKNFSDQLNEKLQVTRVTVQSKKDSVELKLSTVEPAVEEAKQAVSSINKRNLVELRSMNSPPGLVKLALESICVMLGEKVNLTEWKEVRSVILKEDFVNRILNYDADVILNNALLNKMKSVYLKNPDYTFEKVNRSSAACGPLVKWAIAQCTYYEMVLLIDPLRSELSELIKSQEQNEVELEQNQVKLNELTELIEKYKQEYSELIKKVNSITDELSVIQTKLDRSMMIIESLSSELIRWRQEMENMESRQDSVIFLSIYAGCSLFTREISLVYEQVKGSFKSFDSENFIESSYENNIFEYLLGSEQVQEYKSFLSFSDSQIVDNLSVLFYHMNELNNSILAIDPNNFCHDFLVGYFKDNKVDKLTLCSFLDKNFDQVLENAVRFGNILLVKDAEFCTNNIVSLINEPNESFKNKNNMVIQKSSRFRIILLTSSKINLGKQHKKDILSTIKVTTVNFSAGINTCSNMALDTYLNEFAVEMLQKKEELIKIKMESTIKINKLEKELLQTLNDEGNLLEDEKVLNKLTELKKETKIVNDQLTESETFYKELQTKLSFYEDFQKIIGHIYQDVVCKLNDKDVLYNFTLSAYFEILKKTVIKHKNKNVNDVAVILNSFVRKLAVAVSASIFDKDRICFLLDLCCVLIKFDASKKDLQQDLDEIKHKFNQKNNVEQILKQVDEFIKKTLNIKLNKVYSSNFRKVLDNSNSNKVSMVFFTSNMDPSINVEKIFPDIFSIAMGSNEGYEQFEAQLKKTQPPKVILLKNTHLCVEWLNYTLTKLTNISFKLICTFEVPLVYSLINNNDDNNNNSALTIPNSNLLSKMNVVMFEAAPGLKAEMTRLFDTEMRNRMFSEKNLFKVPYYMAMARVHATIVERLRYCPIGWSTLLEFNEVDFKLACDIIDNVLTHNDDVEKETEQDIVRVSNMLANVLYGARIENKFDKKILTSIISVWFNREKIFNYKIINSVSDLNEYFENLSEHTTPEEVGLDASSKNFITMNKVNYLKKYVKFENLNEENNKQNIVEGVEKLKIDEKTIDNESKNKLIKSYEKLDTSLGEAIIEAIKRNNKGAFLRQFKEMKDISYELPVPINSQILLATKQVIVAKTSASWQNSKLRVFANCEAKNNKYREHFLIRKGMKSVGVRISQDKVEISGDNENSMENVCLTWTEDRLQDELEDGQRKVAIPVYTDRNRSELLTVFKFRTDADMDELYQKGAAIFFD